MNFRYLLPVICKMLLFGHCIMGQAAKDLRFLPNDINDRLPHSDINSIMQDKYGFLWFGTYNGLCKYDGKNLNVFSRETGNPNSLSNSRVLCTKELKDGSILIGTEGGGLNHFFPKSQSFKVYKNGKAENSISGDVINTIFQSSNGSIWVGTNSGLDLVHFNDSSTHFEMVFSSPNEVRVVTEDQEGNLLFSSGSQVFEKKKNVNFFSLKTDFNSGVTTILPLSNNRLIIGCEDGLRAITASKTKMITNYPIIKAFEAHDSSIWIGTRGYGLLEMDGDFQVLNRYTTNKSDPRSLTFDEVSCLYEDHSGVLWVGTYGRGLNKLDLRAKKFELYTNQPWKNNSLSGDRIISFYEDSKRQIWIGLRGNGINILDTKNRIIPLSDKTGAPFFGQSVSSFYEDSQGGLWIGTWGGGIVLLSRQNISILLRGGQPTVDTLLTEYSVEKIVEDYEGHVWLSTTNGLLQYIPGKKDYYKGEFREYGSENIGAPLTDTFIRDIFVEKGSIEGEKIVWVGTRNGLNRISISGTEFSVQQIMHNPEDPSSLPGNFITVIMEDREGRLWLSCLDGGIARMIAGRDGKSNIKFKVYNKINGLPNNDIETILEDNKGQFWMGGYGLTRFDPETGNTVGFDLNDGLQSNAFKVWAALKTRDSKLVFGGTKGFNIFNPDEIKVNSIPPKLSFTDIKVNNQSVTVSNSPEGYHILDSSLLVTRHIELPYKLNSFTISFAALHFTSPENNQLKFKLEGVDSDWLTLKGSEASRNYSQLKPGDYTFMFRGSNSDNIWAAEPVSLSITIQKPYWATYYALFIYVVIILGVLMVFRKYSVIQVKEMGELKLDRMHRDQAEELNRLKINFYTEVSHELRTPLTLIKGPVLEILETPSLTESNLKKLNIVGRNVERMTNLVDEIMLFTEYGKEVARIRAAEDDIIKFFKEIQLFFSAEAEGRNIDFSFDSEEDELMVYFDRDKLEKVFFNLLGNAFKFTPDSGIIEITARRNTKNASIIFSVFNTGSPIPEQDIDHIFERFFTNTTSKINGHGLGLSLAHKIITQHCGKIWVENKTDGVCFYIKLPTGKDHFEPYSLIDSFPNSENPSEYFLNTIENGESKLKAIEKDKTVMIVEDNTELRDYLSKTLSGHFKILEAPNGKVGLEQAIRHTPDIVISDLMMPVMDGLSMCRKLKADIHTSHIPIIILTARTSTMHQIEGFEVGADAYITKPFSTQLLLARTTNLMASREKLQKQFKDNINLSPKEITVTPLDERILTQAIDIIEKHMDDYEFGVEELCKEIAMSRSQLYRKIKALTSYSINGFIRLMRLKRAAQLLKQDNSSVTDVMRQVGFENQSYFSRAFKEQFGRSPKQYTVES